MTQSRDSKEAPKKASEALKALEVLVMDLATAAFFEIF